jgi:hypothetical protein
MRSLAYLLAVPIAIGGCGHDIDSPRPTVTSLTPDVVCGAQLTTPVVVAGMNLTPLPTRTLRKTPQLLLPRVTLTESETLDGAGVTGMPISIADDAANPSASHVRWQSEQQLTFDVTPDLLMPGVYDTKVTNPDSHAALLPHSLAVVPPPMVTMVVPPNVCDAQSDQTVTVHGMNFLGVGTDVPKVTILDGNGAVALSADAVLADCHMVAQSVMAGIQLCDTLTFVVPEGSLPPGMYTLVVTNPAPAACASTESVSFVVEPPPTIDLAATTPKVICEGGGTIDVRGTGFLPGATLTLGTKDATTTNVKGDGEAVGTWTMPGFTAGDKLDLKITNLDGCNAIAPKAITVVPGPVLFAVDPSVIYKPVATQVTLYLTSVTPPLASVTLTAKTGGMVTTIVNPTIDPNHPKHVLITVPAGLAADDYTITVSDASGCPASATFKIVDQVTLKLLAIRPMFGHATETNAVSITADPTMNGGLQAGARAYLTPHAGSGAGTAISSSVVDNKTLAGVVPAGVAAGAYDVIVVNPDGGVGVLNDPTKDFQAYFSELAAPPVITGVSPGAIPGNCAGAQCNVVIGGVNFAPPLAVTESCFAPGSSTPLANPPAVTASGATTTSVTVNATPIVALATGTQCFFRVTNTAAPDHPFADADAAFVVAPASLNVATPTISSNKLVHARRGAAVVTCAATPAARFVYVIGGDDGNFANGRTDVEFAASTLTGIGQFATLDRTPLPSGLTVAGAAAVGRFLFLVGGMSGGSSVSTVQRAEVLDPAEAPLVTDADLVPDAGSKGLAPGRYFYRVAALMAAGDAYNPGGETLAGPEFTVNVPMFKNKIDLTIVWSGGVKSLTMVPARIVGGYRVYRGTAQNGEDRYVDVPASATSFTDDGSATFTMQAPLPLGALGKWAGAGNGVPQLNTARAGLGVTIAPEVTTPGRWFLYGGLGYNSGGSTKLPTSYEVLKIDVSTAGTDFGGATTFTQASIGSAGRWLIGGFAATPANDTFFTGATGSYIYFGQGTKDLTLTGNTVTNSVKEYDAGKLDTSTGALGSIVTNVATENVEFGYGPVSAANSLLMIGGATSSGVPDSSIHNGAIDSSNLPQLVNWNANGTGLPAARFLPGVTLDGAYIYIVGGAGGATLTNATDTVIVGTY